MEIRSSRRWRSFIDFPHTHTKWIVKCQTYCPRLQKAIKTWPFFCVTFPWSISSFCHTDKHSDVHRRYASGQCKRFRHHWAFEIVNSSTLVLNAPLWAVVVACLTRYSSCSFFVRAIEAFLMLFRWLSRCCTLSFVHTYCCLHLPKAWERSIWWVRDWELCVKIRV